MQRRIPIGKALFGLGAAALIAAAILPATSWLARLQTQALVATAEAWRPVGADTERRFAARELLALRQNPNDFEIQLALALREPFHFYDEGNEAEGDSVKADTPKSPQNPVFGKLERLRALQGRWGQNPALPAAILRVMISELITVNRDYLENLTSSYQNPVAPKSDAPTIVWDAEGLGKNSLAYLSLFQKNAERGERLDPENAFFPTMLAYVLFAERRDAEARAALQRAARAKRWEDYVRAEIRGKIALSGAVYGQNGFVYELAVKAFILYPHIATMRSLARVAMGQAIERERTGDVATGLDLRRNVARIGALMEETPGGYAGALTGAAVVRMAATYPGGVIPPIDKSDQLTSDARRDGRTRDEKKFEAYRDYLLKIHRPDEAEWYQRQRETGDKITDLYKKADGKSIYDLPPLKKVFVGYAACWAALLNVFWMIVFSGIAALALRRRWGAKPEPVAQSIRLGVGAVLSFLAFVASCAVVDSIFSPFRESGWESIVFNSLFAALGLLSLGFCIFRIWRSAGRAGAKARFWPEMGRFGLSVGATVALLAAVFWPVIQLFTLIHRVLYNYSIGPEFNPLTELGAFAAFVASVLVPLCISLFGIGVGPYRLEAVVSCIARAFRKAALPAAGVLLLLYVGALIWTATIENRASAELRYAIQNERQYLSEIARRP